jgi:AcrR family transcriptional regulator
MQARSVTEQARRAQIIGAAIETIAELGYPRTTFARIAERAGLSSTGLISYHFANKGELIEQAALSVITEIGAVVHLRVTAASTAPDRLRAYILGTTEFIDTHRTQMKALLDIFLNGGLSYDSADEQQVLSPIEQILTDGQHGGDFRDFDVLVMATAIQRAVDGLPFLLQAHPDVDPVAYGEELATLFDLATRAPGRRPPTKPVR